MVLDDLARSTATECIALGRQVSAGDCLGDRCERVGNYVDSLESAVAEAQARNVAATIAVTDRVGNVLALFQMNAAATSVTVRSPGSGVDGEYVTDAIGNRDSGIDIRVFE